MTERLKKPGQRVLAVLQKGAGAVKNSAPVRLAARFAASPQLSALGAFLNRHALLFHIPLSLLVVFAVEWMSRHSFYETLLFVRDHTGPYLFNAYVVFVALTLVFLGTRRTFWRILVVAVFVLLGVVNGIILTNRVSPFGYTDIAMVGDLLTMQNTNYFSAQQGAVCLAALIVFAILMGFLFFRGNRQKSRMALPLRIALVALSFASIPVSTRLLQQQGVLTSYFGNLAQGYAEYGYLYGFGNSVFALGMDEPKDYTAEHVSKVLSETDQGETRLSTEQPVNVVLILLESFFDVSEASFIETDQDPIPVFHALEKEFSSGHLTVPVVGAGTCDSEFEVLTGMSVQFFGPGEYPQKTILKQTDVESFADNLRSAGYSSHVIHNNGANFYSRRNAFSMMGFDTFTSKEMLDITEYNPQGAWPMDSILTQATVDAMDMTPGPDFVYTITVQTHGDYPTHQVYEDPSIRVSCHGKEEALSWQWDYYVNILHEEDQWIADYLEALSARGEPTLVIMFGDHLPTLGLLESEVETKDLYQTKYVTWNNFGMKKQDQDLTTYNLMPAFLDRLGIHGGTLLDYNQAMLREGTEAGTADYMTRLQLLQYDLLYGKRYAYHGEELYPATDIVMGISDVTVDRVYTYGGRIHFYGNGFTKWSKVCANGEPVSTTYESGQHLSVKASAVSEGDEICVRQMGSSQTVLRESNLLIYREGTGVEAEAVEDSGQDTAASLLEIFARK